MATISIGQRVVRSPNWSWEDQDGGEGHLGTVVNVPGCDPNVVVEKGWARVRWDNGYCNNYQVGSNGEYDLLLFDSAPAGVIHSNVKCGSCGIASIPGMRWKCRDEACPDYDLCTTCYMNDEHDLKHSFTRFTGQEVIGNEIEPRSGGNKISSMGVCPGAEVIPGHDWEEENRDVGKAIVLEVCVTSERRSDVTVCWIGTKLVENYRLGCDGKMDLKCTRPGTGKEFYPKHLPLLGSDSTSDGEDRGFQLLTSAKKGDLHGILRILSVSPELINAADSGKTALHYAALHGHESVVKALVERGANIESTTEDWHTPLQYAVEGDEPAIAKYLIEKGANMESISKNRRRSAIHRAAQKGYVDCARVLVSSGCNVNAQDIEKDTPLHIAVQQNELDVGEVLIKAPNIDTNLLNEKGVNAFHCCGLLGFAEQAELIANHFPRCIPSLAIDGSSILHFAAIRNYVNVIEVVLAVKDHGLNLDEVSDHGDTALYLATMKGQSASVEILLNQGANVNIPNNKGHSPLHVAASNARHEPGKIDDTPTLRKVQKRYKDCGVSNSAEALLCYLVHHGALLDLENLICRTPLYYINDPKLKKTLKTIAREGRAQVVSCWEEKEGDNVVKPENKISDHTDVFSDETHQSSPTKNFNEGFVSDDLKDGAVENNREVKVHDLVHQLNLSELNMGPVIGQGQFGVVHRASWRGTPVAVKKISTIGSKRNEFEREVAIHRRATHPNIVRLMALGFGNDTAYIVMQLIEGVSLNTIIFSDDHDNQINLDSEKKLLISCEVLQAVTFMHACNILHLDIKPANILVEKSTTRPYLCDLGLAHIKQQNKMSKSSANIRGTTNYMPPEALVEMESGDQSYRHTSMHDVWSVAGTFTEMYSMKRLWGDLANPWVLMAQAMAGTMGKPYALQSVEPKIRQILEPCFDHGPEMRPSAAKLLEQFNKL